MEKVSRLYRSRTDSIIGGVAGGLANFIGIDPALVRLAFVLLTLLGGSGPLIYLLMVLVIPREPLEGKIKNRKDEKREIVEKAEIVGERNNILAIGLIGLGVYLFLNQIIPIGWWIGKFFWPGVMILAGVYLITKNS